MKLDSIGHYRIAEKIGQGGMGEVYRATDTKLKRDVALKLLPDAFAQDPDRMARFSREAQLLASLNHPNIAAIHGIEEAEGKRALVMELVAGETLAERLQRGPMPLEETIAVAKQIAEALEDAHERGIIHRDLKPANVKITPTGVVKLLDFGLAKALEDDAPSPSSPDLSQSPTFSAAATNAGVILGTAAYMSPEQARGQKADRRSDIWSFGALVLEMLTGKMAFSGDTVSDVLANVLAREPEWEALPETTPPSVRAAPETVSPEERQEEAPGDRRRPPSPRRISGGPPHLGGARAPGPAPGAGVAPCSPLGDRRGFGTGVRGERPVVLARASGFRAPCSLRHPTFL